MREGEKHLTSEGYIITISSYRSSMDCDIIFDSGLSIENIQYNQIKCGKVKNPFHPSIYNIGYIGLGGYLPSIGCKHTKAYEKWNTMLKRCYSSIYHNSHPTYRGCLVDKRWHNFQIFAEWFERNYIDGFELDKDILVKGNRLYSPETCCFVPKKLNSLVLNNYKSRGEYPIGVSKHGSNFQAKCRINGKLIPLGTYDTIIEAFIAYKEVKEANIKDIAEEYKCLIKENVYKELINYKVEIYD